MNHSSDRTPRLECDRRSDVKWFLAQATYLLPPSLLLEAELIAHAVSQQISIDASSFLPCPLSPVSLLRWSLFAAGRGQDVNSFTACGNPTISLAAPVKKGSGTLSAPPPRRVSLHFAPSLLVLRHLQRFGCTAHEHDENACTPSFNFTTWNA